MAKLAKKENRGGVREGAGRPPAPKKEFSDDFKTGIIKALERQAKKSGKSVFDLFAEKMYNPDVQDAVFASLMKTVADIMTVKESKQTVNVHEIREVIMLPQVQQPKIIDVTESKG